MMRLIIAMSFMALICSLAAFFLDILGPTSKYLKFIRRNSIPSILTVLWVVSIVSVCYYITLLLEDKMEAENPGSPVQAMYEYGCYTVTAAGAVAVVATACNLFQRQPPSADIIRRRLMEEWDGSETFSTTPLDTETPPPPYSP